MTDVLIANAALKVVRPKITQYTSNKRISVSRLNTQQQLERSQTNQEKRTRFAYERARKRFLSRFGVYIQGCLLYTSDAATIYSV